MPRSSTRPEGWPAGPPLEPHPETPPAVDEPAADRSGNGATGDGRRRASTAVEMQRWARLAHVYTSMAAFLVVLFFAVTGITLNHPEWTFGFDGSESIRTGTLPAPVLGSGEGVQFLDVSEFARDELHVHGSVTDFGTTGSEGFISYRDPGYAAEVTFDVTTGAFQVAVEEQGLVGVLNDLHKGRDAGSGWAWVIDVAGAFLVVVSVSGLALQLLLRRRRTAALLTAGAGGLALVVVAVAVVR